jgi:hypothetical protein
MPTQSDNHWYAHGWNKDLSWKLILTIIPRIPEALRPPIHFVTSLICFSAMRAERSAARRNLERITGKRGWALSRLTFRLFFNFSKFMVAYCDLPPYGRGALEDRAVRSVERVTALREALDQGRGTACR